MTTNSKQTSTDNKTPHYQISFERFTQHLVDITLTFIADTDSPVLWLPSWIPGSYLMREFSRHITAVHYHNFNTDSDKTELSTHLAPKISKNEWLLTNVQAGDSVSVHYEVYSYDLSVRTAYVDQFRLFGNFTSLALAIEGQEQQPINVTLSVPKSFYQFNNSQADKADMADIKFACGLPYTHLQSSDSNNNSEHQHHHLQADSYEHLIDYPFEIAKQDEFHFIINDNQQSTLPHRFFISGTHHADLGRLQTDVTKICQSYLNWLGNAPFSDYTFLTYASGNDYGGLEHINSTSLITPRDDLPKTNEPSEPSESYQRFLGLCSHEYFHAWWVKTVRPDVMMAVDLRAEAYTPLLWVFEGFTSYIDDFMLQASGVISPKSYLKLLAAQINRYQQTHGRTQQSVADSSFDAWIKLYRNDENTGNAGISYYNKGALVALCLDLTLLELSEGKYRLFDVVKAFYTQAKQQDNRRIGMTDSNLAEVMHQFIDPADWRYFVEHYINGVSELPLQRLLQNNGVSLNHDKTEDETNQLPWGIRVEETATGLKVARVLRDSVASQAGLSANDVIVAIDGLKANKKQLQRVAERQQADLETGNEDGNITCYAFRRDELLTLNVPAKTKSGQSANPSLDKVTLSLQKDGWQTWLSGIFG
ncbi:M61 family metallopeptidase [Psychrobacter sp. I-STPA10]|uniref:M61 family metallopeptidase n=1 Tax=Psychrobacter sp. I-STPA10 TaxID=2585769 RepID=UPI001E655708|nr:PDZ domain-containing protein [Psychrobacter sp. I-STPA10]